MKSYLLIHLLVVAAFTFIFQTADAQKGEHPKLRARIPKGAQGRIFFVSDKAPFSQILNKQPGFINSTLTLTQHFEYVDNYIKAARLNNTNQTGQSPRRLQICNSASTGAEWANAVRGVSIINGWPAVLSKCTSDIYGVPLSLNTRDKNERRRFVNIFSRVGIANNSNNSKQETYTKVEPSTMSKLINALQQRVLLASKASEEIRNKAASNWTYMEIRGNDSTVRRSISCSLHFTTAFRIAGNWYLSTSFTNHPQSHWARDGDRLIMTEYLRVNTSTHKLINTNVTLPINPVIGTDHIVVNNATTRLAIRRGPSSTSGFYRQIITENEATIDAIELAQNTVHHAEDTMLWSNLAIISLPLVLNIIPISLVTKITSCNMLIYIIISDFIGSVPMLIKGIEMLVISRQSFDTLFQRMSDNSEEIVISEVWIAQCGVSDNFNTNGIWLIVISLSSSVLGVLLELLVHHMAKNRFEHNLITNDVPAILKEEEYRDTLMQDVDLEY